MLNISLDDPEFFQKVNAHAPEKFDQEKMAKNIAEEKAKSSTPLPEQGGIVPSEELREKATAYLNKLFKTSPLLYTGNEALKELLALITADRNAMLDRLKAEAVEAQVIRAVHAEGLAVERILAVPLSVIEAERRKL